MFDLESSKVYTKITVLLGDKLNVLVLGVQGMLGSVVFDFLQKSGIRVDGSLRNPKHGQPNIISFEAMSKRMFMEIDFMKYDYVINCIGIIKPRIKELDVTSVQDAYRINSIFPWVLSTHLRSSKTKVIQIATDCVYDGKNGNYSETAEFSPSDDYGSSKMLGEVDADNIRHLRCSIIGPENNNFLSLFEWFNRLPTNSTVQGFLNHNWNGLTTLSFAKIIKAILSESIFESLPQVIHVVPSTVVNKYELLDLFKTLLNRSDINIIPAKAETSIDRTLSTNFNELNSTLWQKSDYSEVKSVEFLVKEMINNLKFPKDSKNQN